MLAPESSGSKMNRVKVLAVIIASGFELIDGLYDMTIAVVIAAIAVWWGVKARVELCCLSTQAVIAASTSHFLV
jgi:hypothetical protein